MATKKKTPEKKIITKKKATTKPRKAVKKDVPVKKSKKSASATLRKKAIAKKAASKTTQASLRKKTILKKNAAIRSVLVKKPKKINPPSPPKAALLTISKNIKSDTPKKKPVLVKERAKKLIISKTESTVSAKIKQTIRVNIAERETTPEVSGQLSLLLPLPKEKLETKDIFNRVKRFKASRNYDPHHIQLNKVKKGGPKPSGKKPLW